jgi:hypothetical protein
LNGATEGIHDTVTTEATDVMNLSVLYNESDAWTTTKVSPKGLCVNAVLDDR